MPSSFVAFALLVAMITTSSRASELMCGPDADPCPSGSRCVPGAGCVSLDRSSHCNCKQTPCPWGQKCDCKSGCEPRQCSKLSDCGRQLLNPRNPCQQLNCSASTQTCVAVPVLCANGARCDRAHGGCPVVAIDEDAQHPERLVVDRGSSLSARGTVHVNTATPGRDNPWVLAMIVILSLFGALWLIFAGYAMYRAWYPHKKGTM